MKYICLSSFFFFFISLKCYAQAPVVDAIKKSLEIDKKNYPVDFTYTFSIGVATNKKGGIDTIIHSKNEAFSSSLLNFETFSNNLKKHKHEFEDYKNEFIFILIRLQRGGDKNNMTNTFESTQNWMRLIRNIQELQADRKLVFLDPILIYL